MCVSQSVLGRQDQQLRGARDRSQAVSGFISGTEVSLLVGNMKGMLNLFGSQENVNSHCNEVLFYTEWANFLK